MIIVADLAGLSNGNPARASHLGEMIRIIHTKQHYLMRIGKPTEAIGQVVSVFGGTTTQINTPFILMMHPCVAH